jgi:hypothetical protein
MTKLTTDLDKKGTIQYVINVLSKEDKFKSKIEKLNSAKDLSSGYTIALRYGRNYIHYNDEKKRDDFFKECHWLGRKLLREDKKEIVIEANTDEDKDIDVEFISEIEKVDNERGSKTVIVKNEIVKEKNLIKRIIEFGVKQLSIDILKECNIDYTIVGSNGSNLVCYLRDFDFIVELININSYVE